jgi:hypothetical protein
MLHALLLSLAVYHCLFPPTMTVTADERSSVDSMQPLQLHDAATTLRFEYCFDLETAQDLVTAAQDWRGGHIERSCGRSLGELCQLSLLMIS